jgi:hypothetical protein
VVEVQEEVMEIEDLEEGVEVDLQEDLQEDHRQKGLDIAVELQVVHLVEQEMERGLPGCPEILRSREMICIDLRARSLRMTK